MAKIIELKCNILIPNFDIEFMGEEGGCLLPRAHSGYHLNKLNNGMHLSWGGNGCDIDCNWCGECFNHIKISAPEAQAILSGQKKNYHD